MSGNAVVDHPQLGSRVAVMLETLAGQILHGKWRLRWSTGSWVKWVPRERNFFADSLANMALQRGASFAYTADTVFDATGTNYVVVSDGAFRRSSKESAAGWAIFGCRGNSMTLWAAGGAILTSCTD
eukprot:1458306-Karenia_brevis.AAC.1